MNNLFLPIVFIFCLLAGCSGQSKKISTTMPIDWSLCGMTLDEVESKYGMYERIVTSAYPIADNESRTFLPITIVSYKDFCIFLNEFNVVIFVSPKGSESYLKESIGKIYKTSEAIKMKP